MELRTLILVAVGGALGTATGTAEPGRSGDVGNAPNDRIMRPVPGVGFLGGFTTFSTLSVWR